MRVDALVVVNGLVSPRLHHPQTGAAKVAGILGRLVTDFAVRQPRSERRVLGNQRSPVARVRLTPNVIARTGYEVITFAWLQLFQHSEPYLLTVLRGKSHGEPAGSGPMGRAVEGALASDVAGSDSAAPAEARSNKDG